MTRSEAVNKVLAAIGAGGTVLANGPDPRAVWARQLVDTVAALEMIRLDPEPPMNWDQPKSATHGPSVATDGPSVAPRKD